MATEDASNLPQSTSSEPDAIISSNDRTIEDYEFFQRQKQATSGMGAGAVDYYKPHQLISNPPRPQDITLELLMASQSHLGHATSLWNPMNSKYIFGVRGDDDPIHIISLDVTAAHLRRACKVVEGVAARGGLILFVGTRRNQGRAVVKAAEMAGGCHLFDKWTPGTLTNAQQILGRCKKSVVDELDREQHGFEAQLRNSAAIKPDLVVCLNPLENYVLLHECGLHNIPTVGIIDTDANPTWVTYPIPANDDSLRCVQVIAGALGRAGEAGQAQRLARAKDGYIDYKAEHGLSAPTKEEVEASKRGESDQGEAQYDEVEETFDDEIEEEEAESEPDAYALRMQAEAEEKRAMERATLGVGGAAESDEQLADLSNLDDEFFLAEDVAQESQPNMDFLAERSRKAGGNGKPDGEK